MSDLRNPRVSDAILPPVVAHPTEGRTAVARGALQVTESLVEARVDSLKSSLVSELEASTASAMEQMAADVGRDPFEGIPDPDRSVVQNFVDMNARLVAASEQSPDRFTELKIRQERILREYMRRYPKLVPHFQQAASGALGYSPIGAEIQALAAAQTAANAEKQAIFAQVIKAADDAKIPAALRLTNPDLYFELAMKEAAARYELESYSTQLKMRQSERTMSAIEAQEGLRQKMPYLMRGARTMILDSAERAIGTSITAISPGDRTRLFEQGMFKDAQIAILQERDNFIASMYSEDFTNSDMTMEQFKAEMDPVIKIFDYAAENVGSETMLADIEKLLKARESSFILSVPNMVEMGVMAKMLGGASFSGSQAIRALDAEFAGIVPSILNGLLGGYNTPGSWAASPAVNPDGSFNPDVLGERLPTPGEMRNNEPAWLRMMNQQLDTAIRGFSQVIRPGVEGTTAEQYRIPAMVMLSKWANTYYENWNKARVLVPERDVDKFVSLLANPRAREVFSSAGESDIPGFNPGAVAGTLELVMGSEAGSNLAGLEELVIRNLGLTHQDMGGNLTQVWDLVDVKWDSASRKPVFTLDEAAYDAVPEVGMSRVLGVDIRHRFTKPKMREAVARMNTDRNATRLGAIIMANAHVNGDSDYVSYADLVVRRYLGGE